MSQEKSDEVEADVRQEQETLEEEAWEQEEAEREATVARTQAQAQKLKHAEMRKRFEKLELLLRKAEAFSQFLGGRMIADMVGEGGSPDTQPSARKRASPGGGGTKTGSGKRRRGAGRATRSASEVEDGEAEEGRESGGGGSTPPAPAKTQRPADFEAPPTLQGGKLRDYQLYGVKWMVKLFENGMHGILADEMGLGKTVQVVSLFAHRACGGPAAAAAAASVGLPRRAGDGPSLPRSPPHEGAGPVPGGGAPLHRAQLDQRD